MSYNPSLEAHQDLLRTAHEIELRREADVEKGRKEKETMEAMKRLNDADLDEDERDPTKRFKGMTIDVPESGSPDEEVVDADEPGTSEVPVKKTGVRKTRTQKAKAARSLAEVRFPSIICSFRLCSNGMIFVQKRLMAEQAARKRMSASLTTVKSLIRSTEQTASSREALLASRKLAIADRKRKDVVGEKIGKHTVKTGEIDVQLTDELSESLRGLQVRKIHSHFVSGRTDAIDSLKGTSSKIDSSVCSIALWSSLVNASCMFLHIRPCQILGC